MPKKLRCRRGFFHILPASWQNCCVLALRAPFVLGLSAPFVLPYSPCVLVELTLCGCPWEVSPVVQPLGPCVDPWVSRGVDRWDGGWFGGLRTWVIAFGGWILGFDGVGGVSWCGRGWCCWDGVVRALRVMALRVMALRRLGGQVGDAAAWPGPRIVCYHY